jgi:hypothetical protein
LRIEDCVLDITEVVSRPLVHRAPEDDWVAARDHGYIPEYLYRFYCTADYFSIDRAPPFLDDPERLLFSFLGGLTLGIRDSLKEARELADLIRELRGTGYSPIKEMMRQEWNREADVRERRSFRYLIVALAGALDQFAEVAGLFFHGEIEGLTVGRAMFPKLREFSRRSLVTPAFITTPKKARVADLHNVLSRHLNRTGDEASWYELFQLYRNKLAHLGSGVFDVAVLRDNRNELYSFTPNRWPLFHRSQIRSAGSANDSNLGAYLRENYVHQDTVDLAAGFLERIAMLLDDSFRVLCRVYTEFRDFEPHASALRSLMDKEETYQFRGFGT